MAAIPLIFPEIAEKIFGLTGFNADNGYLYVSRIGASLMLGWTLLLLRGSFKPIERKGILYPHPIRDLPYSRVHFALF